MISFVPTPSAASSTIPAGTQTSTAVPSVTTIVSRAGLEIKKMAEELGCLKKLKLRCAQAPSVAGKIPTLDCLADIDDPSRQEEVVEPRRMEDLDNWIIAFRASPGMPMRLRSV